MYFFLLEYCILVDLVCYILVWLVYMVNYYKMECWVDILVRLVLMELLGTKAQEDKLEWWGM